MRQRQLSP
ncbi:HMWP1 nonribosomal peptide/polyketide synthase, partial [Yersinia pestis PY-03]